MITFEKSLPGLLEMASGDGVLGLLNLQTFWGNIVLDPPSNSHLWRMSCLPPHTQISSYGHMRSWVTSVEAWIFSGLRFIAS